MKEVTGDLIEFAKEGMFEVIIHGCNCFCTMGSGIARTIADQFPTAYKADCATKKGDRNKLGTFTGAAVGEMGYHSPFFIINAYTQYKYTRNEVDVDYDAVQKVMRSINSLFKGKRVGYPLIGAGLAGGDWNVLSKIIDEELTDVDHTLVIFDPEKKAAETKAINEAGRRVMDQLKGNKHD